jgi:hypothetical protein
MAYIRVALGAEAISRLQVEAGRYEAIPAYANHFRRMGISAADTAVTGSTPDALQSGLSAWDGVVDEVVCRLITANDSPDEVGAVIGAARPQA